MTRIPKTRWCKKCGQKFRTYSKTGKICFDCNRDSYNKKVYRYPESEFMR